ncbi:MAG TPA: hypothetical protein VFJ86_15435 [Usitatibacter sp.]|nr:hypothetical protein [Usitatibacter sp.]
MSISMSPESFSSGVRGLSGALASADAAAALLDGSASILARLPLFLFTTENLRGIMAQAFPVPQCDRAQRRGGNRPVFG